MAREYRENQGIDIYTGTARFVAPKVLRVGDDELHGDRFVLATGSRPKIPDVPGLAQVPYVTSDTVMRLTTQPAEMIILGGGYVAAEMAHIFGALGTAVTIIERGDRLISRQDEDVSARFTEIYERHFDVRRHAVPVRASTTGSRVRLT